MHIQDTKNFNNIKTNAQRNDGLGQSGSYGPLISIIQNKQSSIVLAKKTTYIRRRIPLFIILSETSLMNKSIRLVSSCPNYYRCFNGQCAGIECGISCVRAQSRQTMKLVCVASSKHAVIRSKNKNWLSRNQNVYEWSELLFK